MTIEFTINRQLGYFISKFKGIISDDELIDAYKDFIEKGLWYSGLNELMDISDAEFSKISLQGLTVFFEFNRKVLKKYDDGPKAVAVYTPGRTFLGIISLYQGMAIDAPLKIENFHSIDKAL